VGLRKPRTITTGIIIIGTTGTMVAIPSRASGTITALLGRGGAMTRSRLVNGLLVVAILLISTAPLYAQRQQQNVAKLKADARNVVGIIGADKDKTQAYCQTLDLARQLERADQEKDRKKITVLSEKINQLQKLVGPEFLTLVNILKHLDLNSPDGREIASIIQSLNQSCAD
jgi:hypothetical protein